MNNDDARSVYVLVMTMSHAEMNESTEMPFGSRLAWVRIPPTERSILGDMYLLL